MIRLANALNESTERLTPHSGSARLDAEILFCHSLGLTRAQLFARNDDILRNESIGHCTELVKRREQGEPIAYIIGRREFWSLELFVNRHTLIPRSETELLVELALTHIPNNGHFNIAELGTGSGAIALAIAKERPDCHIDACDLAAETLAVARRNASQHNISNVSFHLSDWFENIPDKRYHVIISNPPYVAADDPHLQQGDLRFEPQLALSAADNGFADLLHIAKRGRDFLVPSGYLLLEHGFEQQQTLMNKLSAFGYRNIRGHLDMSQQPRAVSAQWV